VRILHVTDTYLPVVGGIEVLVHDLAQHQRLDGHEVGVLTATSATAAGVRDAAEDRTIRVRGSVFSDVIDILARNRPDVVHCHSSIVSPLAWRTARHAALAGIPVLATMHSIVPGSGSLKAGLSQLARTMPQSVAWSSVSSTAAAALQPIVGGDVRVLPNGIDPQACSPASPGSNDVPVIVSVMRLARRKRPMKLIGVLARLREQLGDRPWQAVIIGGGPLEAAVRRAVHRAGLSDRVRLTGRLTRPEIMAILARADVYLAPAHLESFGIAALEARVSGLPVVAMRSGGVGQFVADGVNGYLVQDDTAMTLRTAQLLADRALLWRMGQASLADPPELDWATVVQHSLEAYSWAGARVPVEAAGTLGICSSAGR
jgi:glycosyltransferase involved in cell wall biosynthesis